MMKTPARYFIFILVCLLIGVLRGLEWIHAPVMVVLFIGAFFGLAVVTKNLAFAPLYAMVKGDFARSLILYEKLLQETPKSQKKLRSIYLYNSANCCTWMGSYGKSTELLSQIDLELLPALLQWNAQFLSGLNAFLQDQKIPVEVLQWMAAAPTRERTQILITSFFDDQSQQMEAADLKVLKYLEEPAAKSKFDFSILLAKKDRKVILFNREVKNLQEHFFLAWYYLKRNQPKKAKTHFESTLRCFSFENCYSQAARKILMGL